MVSFSDLKHFFKDQDYKLLILADGEPVVSKVKKDAAGHVQSIEMNVAGGVAVGLDPIARATNAVYIARAKDESELVGLDKGKMFIGDADGNYHLRRLFFAGQDIEQYYFGFSNQTLWPLCHVAFEEPRFETAWYDGYKKVNKAFAKAVNEEARNQKKTLVWIHDYQLALVPGLLRGDKGNKRDKKDMLIGMFWHIPWPTWEVFRILPQKKEILKSLLSCDFLAFHRAYQARNFLQTVERELQVRIDHEKQQVHFKDHVTTVKSLPLGIDTDKVRMLVKREEEDTPLTRAIREVLGLQEEKPHPLDWYFENYTVVFGIDRLDYTKGILQRMRALDRFFEKYPKYQGKVVYLGITAPSREKIPAYKHLKHRVKKLAGEINRKYTSHSVSHPILKKEHSGPDVKSSGQLSSAGWKPLHMLHVSFAHEEVLNLYRKAHLCLVTPLDDGMNLVSKEFVIAASLSSDPGMLVLSQFAGSATDLSSSLIVNPYDIEEVADAIREGIEMKKNERIEKIQHMAELLDENNGFQWGMHFLREAIVAGR